MDQLNEFLAPGVFVDSAHPAIVDFAARVCSGDTDDVSRALRLYYAVRDAIIYTPYFDFRSQETYRASACLQRGTGFCVAKAALLAAAARAAGIAARVGYADVKNHLSTPKLRALMGTDVFYFHSYAELYLRGKWVKATPAFDRTLCERFGVRTLEFNGLEDSLMHPYNRNGRRHMEYLRDRGPRFDVPVQEIIDTFSREYPNFTSHAAEAAASQFRDEAGRERERRQRRTAALNP